MRGRARVWAVCLLILLVIGMSVQVNAEPEEKKENKQTEEMASEGDPDLGLSSPSVLLMEESTGTIIYERNADEQRSPASITKIMTLILIFDEMEKGNLKPEDEVVTSAYAKSMGGSQVFLEEGEKQTVETMIKCIVISSGNDASVAMAEHIAGTESEFVRRMNERAKELGMKDTNFEDCCGLTDSANHYTSAHDVAVMSRELILRYPQILEYSSIWMEDITHVTARETKNFTLTNTNKLIRGYDGCIGLKTGSTQVAKYCVSAVAKRSEITLIAVVMGAPDYKVRFSDAAALLNYGFGRCTLYIDTNDEAFKEIPITNGVKDSAAVKCDGEFRYLSVSGANFSEIEKIVELPDKAKAPIQKGEHAGRIVYRLNGEEIGSTAILYDEDIKKAGFGDYLKRTLEAFGSGAA